MALVQHAVISDAASLAALATEGFKARCQQQVISTLQEENCNVR